MFKNILFSFTSEIKATLAEPSIVDRLKNKITIMLSLVEFYKENPNYKADIPESPNNE